MAFKTLSINYKKRERTQNWTTQEKDVLCTLVKENIDIIESKIVSPVQKSKVWDKIANNFNRICATTPRNIMRIREQWRRMKSIAKLEMKCYNNKIRIVGTNVAEKDKPSKLSQEIWQICMETKSSRSNIRKTEVTDVSENKPELINSIQGSQNDTSSRKSIEKDVSPPKECDEMNSDIKIENESNVGSDNEESDDEGTKKVPDSKTENYSGPTECKKTRFDLSGRVNGDLEDEPVLIPVPPPIVSRPAQPQIQRIFIRQNLLPNSSKPVPQVNFVKSEQNLKLAILKMQFESAKYQQETALNEMKISIIKRQLIEKEAEEKLNTGQVKMVGERGAGAGRGGGGGGSIRDAGGSFGKMEAAHEDQYFYNQQKDQLAKLREGLHDEISFHEEQIKRHQEAISRHKKRMSEMENK